MVQVVRYDDADLSLVQRRNVTVLGSDDLALAHALNLRDSGVEVRIGAGEGPVADEAAAEGLRLLAPYDACEEADLVVLFGPSSGHAQLFGEVIEPNLVRGDAVIFGSATALRSGALPLDDEVDAAVFVSADEGAAVRSQFCNGRGVGAYLAVANDATGAAWELLASYASAVGATRPGALRSTVAELADTSTFADGVLARAVDSVRAAGVNALIDAGIDPQVARSLVAQRLQHVLDSTLGASGAGTGPLLVGDLHGQMRRLLAGIRGA